MMEGWRCPKNFGGGRREGLARKSKKGVLSVKQRKHVTPAPAPI